MNPWEILGIDATSDKKLIKRAYAKTLKKCNPEVNPEEFMQLRSAYEFILSSIKNEDSPNAISAIKKFQFKNISPIYFEQKQKKPESKQTLFDNTLANQKKEENERKQKTLNEDSNLSKYLNDIVNYNEFVLLNKGSEAQALQMTRWKKEYQSLIDRLYQLLNDKTLISKTECWNDLLSAPLITDIYRNQFCVDLVENIQSHLLNFSETSPLKPKIVALIIDYLQAKNMSGDDRILTDHELMRISEVSVITQEYLDFKQQQTHLKFWLKQFVWLFFSFKGRLSVFPYVIVMALILYSITHNMMDIPKQGYRNMDNACNSFRAMERNNEASNIQTQFKLILCKLQPINPENKEEALKWIGRFTGYLWFWVIFALTAKRLHDSGKSGAAQFVCLIPLIGVFLLAYYVLSYSDGDNAFGRDVENKAYTLEQYNQLLYFKFIGKKYTENGWG